MFRSFGPVEILIILGIILLIFGAAKLPQIGRSMGKGLREFKEGIAGKGEPTEPPPQSQSTISANGSASRSAEHRTIQH